MARGQREKKSEKSGAVLGWILLAVLLAAVALGAFALWRASSYWRSRAESSAQSVQTAQSTQAAGAPRSKPESEASQTGADTQPEAEAQPQQPLDVTYQEPETLTLMALGDNLIHNCVYWSAELPEGGYDFTPFYADIKPVAETYDLACINQETIYVESPALYGNYPAFGSPTAVGDALVDAGFDVVTQATNHCYDKGETGILDTVRFWRENHPEITVLGIHDSEEDAQTLRVVEKNGIRVAMLNYTYGLNYGLPAKRYMVDTLSSRDDIAADIAAAKDASDFVIVFVHWGDEGVYKPNADQKSWAQFFADEGVDLVIGAHPHVVQPLETVTGQNGNEMPVFYSLGNFLSHQVDAPNMLGGMASVTLEKAPDGTVSITQCEMKPTVNVILYLGSMGHFMYRPMLLEDYTDELAAQHHIAGCGVEALWTLYRQITEE